MEDREIINLFFARDERAIGHTQKKYGNSLLRQAKRILTDRGDAEECVNDVYFDAWNTIPPQRPAVFGAYLTALCRRRSIDRLRKNVAEKRGKGRAVYVFEELEECLPEESGGDVADKTALKMTMESFIGTLGEEERAIFIKRYWYACSYSEIAAELSITEGNARTVSFRVRGKLKAFLQSQGFGV